jgi:hypothetical protein
MYNVFQAALDAMRRRANEWGAPEPSDELPTSHLNNLVRGGQQRFRDGEAEGFGGLKVDDELELGGLDDRPVAGLGAVEDFAGIDADLTITIRSVGS